MKLMARYLPLALYLQRRLLRLLQEDLPLPEMLLAYMTPWLYGGSPRDSLQTGWEKDVHL